MYIDVNIDEDEVVSEISTKVLQDELASRNCLDDYCDFDKGVLEQVYYALRDNDLEKVGILMNPVLLDAIGREV